MKITDFENIYFTCTGNTCRSPMAERVFLEELKLRKIKSIKVGSRQSSAVMDRAAESDKSDEVDFAAGGSSHALDSSKFKYSSGFSSFKYGGAARQTISRGTELLIREKFGDEEFIKNHEARQFNYAELENASLVLTMESHHKKSLRRYIEAYSAQGFAKVYSLGEVTGRPFEEVSDPLSAAYKPIGPSEPIEFNKPGEFSSSFDVWPIQATSFPSSSGKQVSSRKSKSMQYSFDLSPYEETFVQLNTMIRRLFSLDSANIKHISEIFLQEREIAFADLEEEMARGKYNDPGYGNPPAPKTKAFKKSSKAKGAWKELAQQSPSEENSLIDADILKAIAVYRGAIGSVSKVSSESSASSDLRYMGSSMSDLENVLEQDSSWKPSALQIGALKTRLRTASDLVLKNKFRNGNLLDYGAVGNYLMPDVIQTAPVIMRAMLEHDRDKAFYAYVAGVDLMHSLAGFCANDKLNQVNKVFLNA